MGGGSPRIAFKKLQKGVYDGGLAIPDLRKYYLASQLLNINGWVFSPLEEPAYRVDRLAMGKGSYLTELYRKRRNITQLPVHTRTAVEAWRKATRMTGWEAKLTEQTPLWVGDHLRELNRLEGFQKWSLIGIDLLGDVWKGGKMVEFDSLREEFQMGEGEYLRYRQLRHALHCHLKEGTSIPE